MTTSGATSDDKVVIKMTFPFLCLFICIPLAFIPVFVYMCVSKIQLKYNQIIYMSRFIPLDKK